ncbi:hypothetical protein ACEWY4_017852 [Coilia grayii]|uniref:Uncharacterized protein n=1 Tax=Coilia grayii TaxID=363190 RepID=A0ABD1JLF7_9TELE
MHQLETRTLAEEGKGDRDGANPYPLYSAVDREMFHNKNKELWFELSHHEAGFTQPGAFVKTSLLKQHFDAGHVKQQKKRRPMDMVQLQGTLKVASDYAAKIHRPFPAIDVESLDKDCPGSFYVFEERGKPTVIHIPLFNMDNCKDKRTIKKEQHEYTTFQLPYRDQKKINDLADLAAENVRMNRERILEEIRKAAERRKAKC